jgi:uncharacterized protein (TIGR02145 family)
MIVSSLMKRLFLFALCIVQVHAALALHEKMQKGSFIGTTGVVYANTSPEEFTSANDPAFCLNNPEDPSKPGFARFDHHDDRYGYYTVMLYQFKDPFERYLFYNNAARERLFMQNKREFENDSALFITEMNDEAHVLELLSNLRENARQEASSLTLQEKQKIVSISPFFRENPEMLLYRSHAPGTPADSIIPCTTAQVACSENIYTFASEWNNPEYTPKAPPAVDNYPNYGCLGSEPCPTWFYMHVSQAGDIIISIQQTLQSGPGGDVDFICWGPVTSLTDGCANGLTGTCRPTPTCCDNNMPGCQDFYPRGNIMDCSYSADAEETCHILDAHVGEFYILLLTNFSGQPATITFSQTGGTGVTDCNIVIFCSVVAITADTSSCDPNTNTFSITGNVEFSNPPPGGTLIVTDDSATPPVSTTLTPPFVSPLAYTLTGIPCDGLVHHISAAFSDSATCTLQSSYTSPAAVCPHAVISGGGDVCDDGVSTATVTITFSAAAPPFNFTYSVDGTPVHINNYSGPFPYLILSNTAGVYTLDSVSNANCRGTVEGSATVTLLPLPGPPVPTDPVFFRCGPGTVTLQVIDDAGISFRWYTTGTGGSPIYSGNPFTTPPISSTTNYYVESVSDDGNCASDTRIPVTAEVRPVPVLSPVNPSVCSGNAPSITLSSTPPGATFSWTVTNPTGFISGYTSPGGGNTIQETLTNSSSVPASVTYNVTGTLNQCSSISTPYVITVNPLPVPTITPQPVPVCLNSQITYTTESGMSGYTWNESPGCTVISGSTTNQVTVQWTTTGPHWVSVSYTDGNGCTAVAATTLSNIIVNPLPDLVATPASPQTICSGVTASVHFASDVPGTELSTTFNWSVSVPPGVFPNPIAPSSGDISQAFTNNGNSPASVVYTISPVSNGCTSNPVSYSYTITVNPVANVSMSPASQEICSGGTTGPVSLSSNVGGTTFSWTVTCDAGISSPCPAGNAGNSIPGATLTNSTLIPQYVTYTITPTYNSCIGNTNSHVVKVKARPLPTITGPASACLNVPGYKYYTESGMNGYTWVISGGTWTPGMTPDTIYVTWTSAGLHTVSIDYTIPGNCNASSPTIKNITVNSLPTPALNGNSSICTGIQTTYTTDAGMTNYLWSYSSGATYVSGGGMNEDFLTLIWNSPTPQTVSVNYTMGTMCTAAWPTVLNVTVNQSTPPVISSPQGNAVCAGSTATYSTQSGMTGYTWEVASGGTLLGAGNTNTITVRWDMSSPPQYVRANFTNQFSCTPPNPTEFGVTVNPLPDVTIIPPPPPICQDYPSAYIYSVAPDPTCTFTWSVLPLSSRIITPGPGPNQVQVQWITSGIATVVASGTYIATGCSATSAPLRVDISPKPAVKLTPCFDLVTTQNAKRFQLKGGSPPYSLTGSPLQGVYLSTPSTSALQTDASGNYYFNPALAAVNTYSISYRYTSQYGCPNTTSSISITVLGPDAGCGTTMTDPRDGKVYATTFLAGRCWMAQNLDRGGGITQSQPQTDNCVVEKYCPPSDATCLQGGYYQWDELVQYRNTDAPFQGNCPPAWHVPSETEFQSLIDNLDPTFPPPSANALVGAVMKDPAKTFDVNTNGIYYLNNSSWSFTSGLTVTMFWTSTTDASGKAIARGLNNPYNSSISRYASSPGNAFPVRCVKD